MRTVYEARNSLEAHVVRDVLRQQGITAHVLGEFLQGGMGDLPAGMVRLAVEEPDADRAETLVRAWDAEQTEPTPPPTTKPAPPTSAVFALGVLAGALLMAAAQGLLRD